MHGLLSDLWVASRIVYRRTRIRIVGGYYLHVFWVSESQFPPYIRSTNVWGKAMEGR